MDEPRMAALLVSHHCPVFMRVLEGAVALPVRWSCRTGVSSLQMCCDRAVRSTICPGLLSRPRKERVDLLLAAAR